MSELGLEVDPDERERRKRRAGNGRGCLAVIIAMAVLVGGGYLAYDYGMSALKDRFSPAADYEGPGTGSVVVEVEEGDVASDIGRNLLQAGVVASVEAFIEAANEDPASRGIQVGFYELQKQMPAEEALAVLVDPANMLRNNVGFPEGLNVEEIVAVLAEQTDFTAKQYRKVLNKPKKLGLPDYAQGDPEGYLFPATYQIGPDATPRSILRMMVDRFEQAAESLDLVAEANRLGISPHDVVTVASLIQAEARFDKDFRRVSRVIYNRLDEPMPLQFDSTVHYAVGKTGRVGTSDSERDVDSPYNTYKNPGLPPGPINAPGEQALAAALNPVEGPWLYFVTTNPDTGETKFAVSYADHLKNKAEFDAWCAQSETC